jgi:hypothetical protein
MALQNNFVSQPTMSAASTVFSIVASILVGGLSFWVYSGTGDIVALVAGVVSAIAAICSYMSYRAFKRSQEAK